ncbi:MAG: ABC transporter permease, partial [Clostridia bacterium]|nr:ABC transporter permease [Clostridia bacterium]
MKSVKLFIQEHIAFKKQLLVLAKADVVKTYRGASLGWLWALIKPSITIFVYFFAFSIGIRASKPVTNTEGVTFP